MTKTFLITIIVAFCLVTFCGIASADDAPVLPEGIIRGTVSEIIAGKGNPVLVKITGDGKEMFLEVKWTKKIKIGTSYEFYPVYDVNRNVRYKNRVIGDVYRTVGIIAEYYKDQQRFTFKNLQIGENLKKYNERKQDFVKSVKNNNSEVNIVEEEHGISVMNYKVGNYFADIKIMSDLYDKIYSISFVYDSKNNTDENMILTLCSALESKYKLDSRRRVKATYNEKRQEHIDCMWDYAGIQVSVTHNDENKVFSNIIDVHRAVQNYTNHFFKLEAGKKDFVDNFIKKELKKTEDVSNSL